MNKHEHTNKNLSWFIAILICRSKGASSVVFNTFPFLLALHHCSQVQQKRGHRRGEIF
jgi:hypothetical protein